MELYSGGRRLAGKRSSIRHQSSRSEEREQKKLRHQKSRACYPRLKYNCTILSLPDKQLFEQACAQLSCDQQ